MIGKFDIKKTENKNRWFLAVSVQIVKNIEYIEKKGINFEIKVKTNIFLK